MVPSILEGDGLGARDPPAIAEEVTGPGPARRKRFGSTGVELEKPLDWR